MIHPLLTKGDNPQYNNGKQTIRDLEKKLTVCEMIGACKFNIEKYRARKKGTDEQDEAKAKKYDDYLRFLGKFNNDTFRHLKVSSAISQWKIKLDYLDGL